MGSVWVRKTPMTKKEELEELNQLRVRFVEKLTPLHTVLKKRRKTVKEITLAVYEYLVQEKIQEQLAELEQKFQEEGELALAKEYAQIYRIVLELFDKFVELLGEEEIPLKEYCELLDAGLEEAKVGVIPPSLDQVVIGDVERTRIKNIRALFFVGANDTLLPGNAGARGLLSERDRKQFQEKKMNLSPGPKEKLYIQKFYLYMNLTKPSELLYLSWAKVSGEGKALRPAYLIQDLMRLFPVLIPVEEDRKGLLDHEMMRRNGLLQIAEGLREREHGLNDSWKELYRWFVKDEQSQETLKRIIEAGFYRKDEPSLGSRVAKELFWIRSVSA